MTDRDRALLEQMDENRRMNRDGSVTTRNNPQGDVPRGEQGGEGSGGGAGGPRNAEDLATEVLQLRELVERLSSRQGSAAQEELVIEFQEFDKYAKIHTFGKAVEAGSFECPGRTTDSM